MIDVNGDCFSDIVMLSGSSNNKLELYIKNNHNGYDYSEMSIGKNVTWMSFGDFDSNGSPDIFFVVF